MIRPIVLAVWIVLIFATAVSLQVIANWVLGAGLALYVLWQWHGRRRRIAPQSRRFETPSGAPPSSTRVRRWH
jgi:hypothetical protein